MQGQGQKYGQKHKTKELVQFHNHLHALTMLADVSGIGWSPRSSVCRTRPTERSPPLPLPPPPPPPPPSLAFLYATFFIYLSYFHKKNNNNNNNNNNFVLGLHLVF